jgi:hypothetical protein
MDMPYPGKRKRDPKTGRFVKTRTPEQIKTRQKRYRNAHREQHRQYIKTVYKDYMRGRMSGQDVACQHIEHIFHSLRSENETVLAAENISGNGDTCIR